MTTIGTIATWLRRTGGVGLLVLSLGFSEGGAAWADQPAPTHVVIYPVLHADLESVRDPVAGLLGTEGQVMVDRVGGRLIVNTTTERHALVAQLLKELDVAPLNVQIEVRFKLHEHEGDRGAKWGGSGRSWPSPQGQTTRFNVKLRANDNRSEGTEDVRQILLVASGREGALRVSESVPYLEWFHDYGMRCGLIQSRILWQEVGAYLTVQPQVIGAGPQIRIRLTPELRGLVDRNPFRVRYSTVTTEVMVNDGATLDLGGLLGNRDFYGRFLVGFDQANQEQTLDITLTPRLNRGR